MKKLRVFVLSAVQTSFWASGEGLFLGRDIPALTQLGETLGFCVECFETPVTTSEEAAGAVKKAQEVEADFLLVQATTFAAGGIIIPLAKAGIPLGIWGVPEVKKNGPIPGNSFCGVNMFCSIVKQYVNENIPYKWFYGKVEDEMFTERFKTTIQALRAVSALKGARIGLVGGVAPEFYDLGYDEGKLMKKLEIQVFHHDFSEVREIAMSMPCGETEKVLEHFIGNCRHVADDLSLEGLRNMANVYLAIKRIKESGGYDGVAISCWPKFRKELGIVVCAVIGRLLEDEVLAACEGDVESLITMIALRALSGNTPMLMDCSKFDEKDQSVLMWHCGSAPNCYADDAGVDLQGHYKPGSRVTCADEMRVAGVHDLYYKAQPVTVARLSQNGNKFFTFSGEFFEKTDRGFDGSRGWLGKLKNKGMPMAVRDLVETIMTGGLQHHYAVVAGDVEDSMREAAAWLRIDPVEVCHYMPFLQNG